MKQINRNLAKCFREFRLHGAAAYDGTAGVAASTGTGCELTFRHRASCILGQAFHFSPENAFYVFNQQIYLII